MYWFFVLVLENRCIEYEYHCIEYEYEYE